MATVFLAEDERLGRNVAVKRLHSDSPEDAALRFEREAKVGASLSHPNMVTVFDTVPDEEGVLIVMEYVEGENLAQLMARERVPAEQAIAIIKGVAGALDHAHQAGVVHRDVKPANILVGPDGKAKLVDLGIATATERTRITQAGTVLGTPSYMAPEQLEDGRITKAVDVYALAAVAFELLSGKKARQGRTPVEIAHQIASQPVPDLLSAWPDAPPAAAAALERAMSREPSERPSTAGELAREMDEAFAAPAPEPEREPETTARMEGGTAAVGGVPFERVREEEPAPRAEHVNPYTDSGVKFTRTARRGAPRWLPLLGLLLVAAVIAGSVIALATGGNDKPVAPAIPAEKKKPAKQKSDSSAQQTPSQSTTTTAPATGAASPDEGSRLHAQAFNLANQGQYEQAIALEKKAIPMLENSGRMDYWYALYNLGHALRLAGHPDEAIPVLQKRLESSNQRGTVMAELKKAQKEAGK